MSTKTGATLLSTAKGAPGTKRTVIFVVVLCAFIVRGTIRRRHTKSAFKLKRRNGTKGPAGIVVPRFAITRSGIAYQIIAKPAFKLARQSGTRSRVATVQKLFATTQIGAVCPSTARSASSLKSRATFAAGRCGCTVRRSRTRHGLIESAWIALSRNRARADNAVSRSRFGPEPRSSVGKITGSYRTDATSARKTPY